MTINFISINFLNFVDLISIEQDGNTPFHLACKYGHFSTIKKLLSMKVDLSIQNKV